MSLLRASFLFFEGGYGWSVNWFLNQSPINYGEGMTKAVNLANKMTPIMGNATYINGIRLSDESTFRDVLLRFYGTGTVGFQGSYTGSAPPATALLMSHHGKVAGAIPAIRPFRGIPLSMVTSAGIFTPTVPWTAALGAYYLQLGNDGWGWKGATTRTQRFVAGVVANNNQTARITLSAAMTGVPLNTPITVSIGRVKGANQINGTRQVVFISETVMDTVQQIPITPYTTGGTVLWSQKGFVEVDGAQGNWRRLAERKPGRPFYLSRGRLSRRAA